MPSTVSGEEEMLSGGLASKLKCPTPISRLRVEKIEGGLMVAGVVIAANCQIALPAFGLLFMFAGAVLTAASYRGPGEDEDKDSYAARIAFTGNSRILGPICIAIGLLMLALGILLCMLTRRARRRERRVGFHCPLHGDFYPLRPIQGISKLGVSQKEAGRWPKISCFKNRSSGRSGTNGFIGSHAGPPQCPHSILSSTRSSLSSSPLSPCPTPMPFLVTSNSVSSGMVQSVGANMSPDQSFGSIRSLSVTREVASFPLSRTPTPPPQHRPPVALITTSDDTKSSPHQESSPRPEVRVIAPSHRASSTLTTSASGGSQSSRKSVSILLPEESAG
ncbi:uncharacterized protein LOC135162316 isoform X4 [Diachasmimorpha longicaudata]|uniref:uncharacterized protein LOC135162316 isoform X4 n=1 Tax=Diachasmimorpha longicaudata TaxID=58733 RepID=UPI0030B90EC3